MRNASPLRGNRLLMRDYTMAFAHGIIPAERHGYYMMRNASPRWGNRLLLRNYTMINHGTIPAEIKEKEIVNFVPFEERNRY